jgi:UDP-3-O-[3-hydroxymyristoyl] glucosamine N-acyltransferase
VLEGTSAGAVVVHRDMLARVPPVTVPIVTAEPYAGWARVAALFHPVPPLRPGAHPAALVAGDARFDLSTEIGPFALVEVGAEVGARCRIGSLTAVSQGVVFGADCRIGALDDLAILDTEPEVGFDDIALLASPYCLMRTCRGFRADSCGHRRSRPR